MPNDQPHPPAEPPAPREPAKETHHAARLRAVQVRTDDLVRLRVLFIAAIRLMGLVMALSCMVPFGSWLAEGLSDSDLWYLDYYWPRILLGFFLLLAGSGVAVFGGLLGVLLVRHRPGGVACPMCRFELTSLDEGRCTECGYELSPALPTLGVGAHERVLATRIVVFAVLRVVALGLLVMAIIRFFVSFAIDFTSGLGLAYRDAQPASLLLVTSIVGCFLAVLLWILAGPLSAAMVPGVWIRKLSQARKDDA